LRAKAQPVSGRATSVSEVSPRAASGSGNVRWNHNLHYDPVVLEAIPTGCRRALDVGCGEGTLTRRLRRSVPEVVGLDIDPASVELASAHPEAGDIRYLVGDFLRAPIDAGSFDLVVSVAVLHQMDFASALARMRDLVGPRGALAVVGLARSRLPADLPLEAAAIAANGLYRLRQGYWDHPSPERAPTMTFEQVHRVASATLPGVRFRRHLLWRYSLVWAKPC
jgi:SAM-dependent methyltransferase